MNKRNETFKKNRDKRMDEVLKILRTNIHFLEDKKKRVVLCTSTIPQEGKSFVASNYALSAALSGEKVLLIDCDIRRPRAHCNFDIEVEYGMADVLTGSKKTGDVILKNIEENLDLLPSKHLSENVTELFLGNRMKELMRSLKKKYDLIVLDTPPLLVAADAAILSQYSDGVVYICGYNMVAKKELIQAKRMLLRANAKIYGVVVNKIEQDGYSTGNYGYYSYDYKYQEEYMKE